MTCHYSGDREAALAGLLYDDLDAAERASFEAHALTCAVCRDDLEALRGVRRALPAWTPPAFARLAARDAAPPRRWAALREIPAWAQVAAAMLVLGVSAGVANVNVRYDHGAVTVRTGWTRTGSSDQGSGGRGNTPAPWKADLAALEQSLRGEIATRAAAPQVTTAPQAMTAVAAPGRARGAAVDDEMLRRVRALIDESERRQQRELALRLAQVVRDLDGQRRADLVRIDRNLGLIQNNTGAEVLRQRELLNYLVRVSQKP